MEPVTGPRSKKANLQDFFINFFACYFRINLEYIMFVTNFNLLNLWRNLLNAESKENQSKEQE